MRVSRSSFVVAAAALAAAIGTSGAAVVAQTAAAANHINIGTPGQQGNAGVYYAQDMGFFKKAGLDVTITTLRRGSGAGIVAAVTGGSLDVGEADLMSAAAARAHGIKIAFLAPSAFWINTAPTAAMLVAKASPIHGPKDFAGKTIGVPSLSGISRISTNAWLDQGGADLASVKFVEIPTDSAIAALARGTIDAAVLTEPTLTAALADNHVIGTPLDAIAKQFVETGWFAADDWVAKNPQVAAKFAVAMRDAQRWANANPGPAAAIFEKYSGIPAESLKNTVHTRYGDALTPPLMQPVFDVAYKYHAIAQPMAAADMINPAVASLPR